MAPTEQLPFLNSTDPPIHLHSAGMPDILRFKDHYFKLYAVEEGYRVEMFNAATGELRREMILCGYIAEMAFASFESIDDNRILVKYSDRDDLGQCMMIDRYDTDNYQISEEPDESGNVEYGLYPYTEADREGYFDYHTICHDWTIQIPGGTAQPRGRKSYNDEMKTTILTFNRIKQKDQYVCILWEARDSSPVILQTVGDPKYGYPDLTDSYDMRFENTDSYVCTDDGYLWKLEFRDWQWHRLRKVTDVEEDEKAPMVAFATDTCVVLQEMLADDTMQRVFLACMDPLSLAEIAFHSVFQRVSPAIRHKLLEAKVVDTKTLLELLKVE